MNLKQKKHTKAYLPALFVVVSSLFISFASIVIEKNNSSLSDSGHQLEHIETSSLVESQPLVPEEMVAEKDITSISGNVLAAVSYINQGLISHWSFDNGDGSTSQGESNDLSASGINWSDSGYVGKAASFDGDDYLHISDQEFVGDFPSNSFSVSVWVKPGQSGKRLPILSKQGNQTRGVMVAIESDNRLSLEVWKDSSTAVFAKSNSSLSKNSWHHVVVTYLFDDTSTAKLYINGVEEDSVVSDSGPPLTNDNSLEIGRYHWNSQYQWNFEGEMDELGLYSRVLSQDEVTSLFSDYDSQEPNPDPTPTQSQLTPTPTTIPPTTIPTVAPTSYPTIIPSTPPTLPTQPPYQGGGRNRVRIIGNNIVADNGWPLRGETHWVLGAEDIGHNICDKAIEYGLINDAINSGVLEENWNRQAAGEYNWDCFKAFGLNSVRVYASIDKLSSGLPLSKIDRIVNEAESQGFYVMIDDHHDGTPGDGQCCGDYDTSKARNFWNIIAPRYKDRQHVFYELKNEPVAWSASNYNDQDIEFQSEIFHLIRRLAPDSHIVLWSFSHDTTDMVDKVNQAQSYLLDSISHYPIDYSNASVGFHVYASSYGTNGAERLREQFPIIQTEIGAFNSAQYPTRTESHEDKNISWFWLNGYRENLTDFMKSKSKMWGFDPVFTTSTQKPTNTPAPTYYPPTVTPTPTQALEPTPTPIPTISPIPQLECVLTDAYWSTQTASAGEVVELILLGNNCDGQEFEFAVKENDTLFDDDVLVSEPAPEIMTQGKASATWVAEWQCDGEVFGSCLFGDPEYYFTAWNQHESISSSQSEVLVVSNTQAPPSTPTPTPTLVPTPSSTSSLSSLSIAHWPFEQDGEDMSPQENNLSLVDVSIGSGKSGSGLLLNGVGSFAYREHSNITGSMFTNEFSIAGWVKLDRLDQRQPIVSKQGKQTRGLLLAVESDNRLNLEIWDSPGHINATKSNKSLTENRWYHLATTYTYLGENTYQVDLYVDGVLDNTAVTTGPLMRNTIDLNIGRYFWSSRYNWYLDGAIDELYVFDRPLSRSEIYQLTTE